VAGLDRRQADPGALGPADRRQPGPPRRPARRRPRRGAHVTAAGRITRLRAANAAAADLATVCALAARVEPDLLRRLRLLLPRADAAAEADLWFSDLLAGRDATAIALDPLVADVLRADLRGADRTALREAAWAEISRAHAGAHWSVRLEERIHYLDTARPPGAAAEIDDLLLAAMDRLRTETDPRGMARWLLGAAGRGPAWVRRRTTARAAEAAASLHLDGQAPAAGLLGPAEAETWLPWLTQALPQVHVPVRLLDGAVVLGGMPTDGDGADAAVLVEVPDTDPLVLEIRWNDGARDEGRRVRFRVGEPVQVETGTRSVELVTLTGASYRLAPADEPAAQQFAGRRFDHLKAALRPCLAREAELGRLRSALADPSYDRAWIAIAGRPGRGGSTLLVAAVDDLASHRYAVVEHFFTDPANDPAAHPAATPGPPGRAGQQDDPAVVRSSCLAQLAALYPKEYPVEELAEPPDTWAAETIAPTPPAESIEPALVMLAERGAFRRRPLVIALDGLHAAPLGQPPFPGLPPPGVRYLVCAHDLRDAARYSGDTAEDHTQDLADRRLVVGDDRESDRRVCVALVERDAAAVERAFAEPVDAEALAGLVDDLPRAMVRLLGWVRRQPPDAVTVRTIPPMFTTAWPDLLDRLDRAFPGLSGGLLDLLRAADGRHTWADCAEAASTSADLYLVSWQDFWDACVAGSVVADVRPEELVRLPHGAAAELADPAAGPFGERILGLRHDPPADFVRTASPTRLAAAVGHALAAGDLADARTLCTDLGVLRRRYAEDPAGLLEDLAAVADRTGDADLRTLHVVVRALAAQRGDPAGFAGALHDRLAEYATLHAVPDLAEEPAALPPLRVRTVIDELDLRASTYVRTVPGPALALAPVAAGTEEPGLVTDAGVRTLDLSLVGEAVPDGLRGAAGSAYGYVGWSDTHLYVDRTPDGTRTASPTTAGRVAGSPVTAGPVAGSLWQVGSLDGPVDYAVRLPEGAAVASPDGTVTLWELPPDGEPVRRRLVGHGGRVTAVVAVADASTPLPALDVPTVTASEDGTVRIWPPGSAVPWTRTGHRGAVRCLTVAAGSVVSGGDDGCLFRWTSGRDDRPPQRWHGHEAAVTCLATAQFGAVVSGAADGRVAYWDPAPDTSAVLGSHNGPVRGIAVLPGGLVVSWGHTVCFWAPRQAEPAVGTAGRFPGGVSALVAGELTYTVLCGDGSVQRRLLPDEAATQHRDRPERGCLAVTGGSVYLGLNRAFCQLPPDGEVRFVVDNPVPFVQAAAQAPDAVVVRDASGALSLLAPPTQITGPPTQITGPPTQITARIPGRFDLVAATPRPAGAPASIIVATATGTEASLMEIGRTGGGPGQKSPSRPAALTAPAEVTSLAAGSDGPPPALVAGLANGETWATTTLDERTRTMPGDGTPVTALALTDDGAIVTGSAAGAVRRWPDDPDHGPTTGPRHDGPVTGIAAVGPWVVTAGRDGRLVLWDPAEPQPVHEIALGVPVVALAAEAGGTAEPPLPTRQGVTGAPGVPAGAALVAARDARGRLWRFVLDVPQNPVDLLLRSLSVSGFTLSGPGGGTLEITDFGLPFRYELAAIRCTQGGRPVRVRNAEPWPAIGADGRFAVPWRPPPGHPLLLRCETLPADAHAVPVDVEADLVSRSIRGYRATSPLGAAYAAPPESSAFPP